MEVGWPNPPSRNWVRPGLNRLERVHAVFVCEGFAKAEKVRVLRCRIWIGDMNIPPFRIGLPDLHHGVLDGPALFVGSSARHMNDFALGHAGRTRDRSEVVVVGHRPGPVISVQIERPFVLLGDRKSTRLNSSHSQISYAVFCLKKKKNKNTHRSVRPAICRTCSIISSNATTYT